MLTKAEFFGRLSRAISGMKRRVNTTPLTFVASELAKMAKVLAQDAEIWIEDKTHKILLDNPVVQAIAFLSSLATDTSVTPETILYQMSMIEEAWEYYFRKTARVPFLRWDREHNQFVPCDNPGEWESAEFVVFPRD